MYANPTSTMASCSMYCPSSTYPTALTQAIEKGDLDQFSKLLPHNFIQLPTWFDGSNVLHMAVKKDKIEFVKLILERMPDLVMQTNRYGETPLFYATSAAVIELLLKRGANPNARGYADKTVLMKAVVDNNLELFKTLLSFPKIQEVIDMQRVRRYGGDSVLHMANYCPNSCEYINALLELGANRTLHDKNGMTAFDIAENIRNMYEMSMDALHPGNMPPYASSTGPPREKKAKRAKRTTIVKPEPTDK